MKKLFLLLTVCGLLAFASCRHAHDETTTAPNSGTTGGPTDTTKMSETGSPNSISAQGQTKSLDTNHKVKATGDSAKH